MQAKSTKSTCRLCEVFTTVCRMFQQTTTIQLWTITLYNKLKQQQTTGHKLYINRLCTTKENTFLNRGNLISRQLLWKVSSHIDRPQRIHSPLQQTSTAFPVYSPCQSALYTAPRVSPPTVVRLSPHIEEKVTMLKGWKEYQDNYM